MYSAVIQTHLFVYVISKNTQQRTTPVIAINITLITTLLSVRRNIKQHEICTKTS